MMVIIAPARPKPEPAAAMLATAHPPCALEDVFAYTQADHHIVGLLRAGPMKLTSVLNVTARLVPSRCKRKRMAIKHAILIRLCELIRSGRLRRIRRKFIGLPV
jgi:hypothetical protein